MIKGWEVKGFRSPSAPVLYWLSHLTCISSLKAKNEWKTLIYTQQKISHTSTFILGNNRPYSDTWVIFNYRMASFMDVCSISPKDMTLLKMDPQLEGAVEVHPFSQTNVKFKPFSSVDLNTGTSFSHTKQLNIFCQSKYEKVCRDRKPWFITIFCFTPPPKARIFPPRRQFYHS